MSIRFHPLNDRKVTFFFDIDNCLYKKSLAIHQLTQKYIHKYFVSHLQLDDESAEYLHRKYYEQYGLAIQGLVKFNHIDAMEYNKEVDDALPLESILKPNSELREMLLKIDRTKIQLWLFTNAYVNHGLRVVRLLGIDDLFDGITYCDYSKIPLVCKPTVESFDNAMRDAQALPEKCYYVDDSYINIKAAYELGWQTTIHYIDPEEPIPIKQAGHFVIRDILELPDVVPEVFTENSSEPSLVKSEDSNNALSS